MRILLIEDDEVLSAVLVKALEQQRYAVDTVDDGRFGLEYAEGGTYDLLLVDVGLPRLDGISLTQQLRNEGCKTPILLMTAKDAPEEKIRGLDAGADDYLTKPLDIAELQARLRALLRRGEVSAASVLEVGPLRLDPTSCQVSYDDEPLKLTPKEYSLLELFLRSPSRVFSRGQIVEHLWTFDDPPLEDSVKAHIKGLRRRLKKAGAKDWIENVYGLGYRLNPKLEAISSTEDIVSDSATKSTLSQSSSSDSVEAQFNRAIAQLWKEHEGTIATRLNHLKAASQALAADSLTPELSQTASQAAHKLAGVLGMFGKEQGTEIARTLETAFSSKTTPNSKTVTAQLKQLTEIIHATQAPTPHSPNALPPQISKSPNPHPIHILAVDDDPLFLSTLSPMLTPWGVTVTTLSEPEKFWPQLERVGKASPTENRPDLLILDLEMPGHSGIELCQQVRDSDDWQNLPILILTANANAASQVFSAGADDYAVKPILGPELIARITNRLERTRLLRQLSSLDAQTGLTNQVQAQRELTQLIVSKQPFTLALLRLANLAKINLMYGHSVGNSVLKAWGDELKTHLLNQPLHPHVVVSYWGNGEFIIGLPDASQSDAKELLSTVLKAFRQRVFTTPVASSNAKSVRFQSSYELGLSDFPEGGETTVMLYQVAAQKIDGE